MSTPVSDKGYPWEFPDEPAAEVALQSLTEQALEGGTSKARVLAVRNVNNGSWRVFIFQSEARFFDRTDVDGAMSFAQGRLCSQGIRPPGWVLGEAIGKLETQALLYWLALRLPPSVADAVREFLKGIGVHVPDSIPDIAIGTIGEVLMAIKVTDVEILKALGASFTLAASNLEAAKADGDVTTDEIVKIVEESAVVALKETIGNDVPGLDRFVDLAKGVIGALLPLILKPAVKS